MRYKFLAFAFWLCKKHGLIRRLRKLIPKFMMSQRGQRIIILHIFSNISRSKDNQAIKNGQL